MWRRLKEDRNQHYEDLTCPCWTSPGHMARFKEQPPKRQCYCCSSPRYNAWASLPERLTLQERRFLCEPLED
jgi:hypothetical protein